MSDPYHGGLEVLNPRYVVGRKVPILHIVANHREDVVLLERVHAWFGLAFYLPLFDEPITAKIVKVPG
jgi:hypothetical protein